MKKHLLLGMALLAFGAGAATLPVTLRNRASAVLKEAPVMLPVTVRTEIAVTPEANEPER